MDGKLQQLQRQISSLAVFRNLLSCELFSRFLAYRKEAGEYASLVSEIYEKGGSLTELVKECLFLDENVYVKGAAQGKKVTAKIEESAKRELFILSDFAALTREDFALDMGIPSADLPDFDSQREDFCALYKARIEKIDKYGYGVFSSAAMFRFSETRGMEKIGSADKTQLTKFVGYEEERGKVVENTKAFLEGRPAANVLLCGDAGTGKSSTVKAVANAFFEEGLRLIELRKDQLRYLPDVMSKISGNPLKFLIFIDDLSFNQNDDDFSMLKAALEGSASAMAENAVIYATSNRRHIVKESFSDREGDDVHRNDTLQETLSLSERFGLTVLFSKPSKKLYLEIVKALARRMNISLSEAELELKAEAFALRKGNRSARCAEQFINSLL